MFVGCGHRWGNSFNHQEPKAQSTIWMIVFYLYLVVRLLISIVGTFMWDGENDYIDYRKILCKSW